MDIQIFSQHDFHNLTSIRLNPGQLHIWFFSVTQSSLILEARSCLSSEECAHVEHLTIEKSKKLYIASYGIRRILLANYLGISSDDLIFQTNEHGKPSLNYNAMLQRETSFSTDMSIHFNISHSGEYAVFIFSLDSPIGIDIQQVHPSSCEEMIVKRMFHPNEQMLFSTLTQEKKTNLFYRFWTIREAFLKALGCGFSMPSNTFCIEYDKSSENYYKITKSPEDYSLWRIKSIPAPENYMCSIAYLEPLPERNSV